MRRHDGGKRRAPWRRGVSHLDLDCSVCLLVTPPLCNLDQVEFVDRFKGAVRTWEGISVENGVVLVTESPARPPR